MFSKQFWILFALVAVLSTALTHSPTAPWQAQRGWIVPCLVCLPPRVQIQPALQIQPPALPADALLQHMPFRRAGQPSGWEGVIAPTDLLATPIATPAAPPRPPRDDRHS